MRLPNVTYDQIKDILAKHPEGMTTAEIRDSFGYDYEPIYKQSWTSLFHKRLTMLAKYREVERIGKRDFNVVWRLRQ